MRVVPVFVAVLGLALVAGRSVLADGEGGDDRGGWSGAVVRPQHDVVCSLRVAAKKGATLAGTRVRATLRVSNKGRKRVRDVGLAVYADSTSSTPLWSQTTWIRGRRTLVRKLRIDVPAGATSLVAVARCEEDDNPGNNIDTVNLGDGTTGGAVPGTHSPSAVAGAATFAANCASCHGAGAQGTSQGPRILGESADDVYEAVREGEDGMPRFLGLTTTDAKNIAAFLADPSAATAPSQPPTLPPSGQAPTYAGQIQPMLASSCAACHQGTSAPMGVRLDTYAGASAAADAALAAMQAGRMPPGGVPLPATTIGLFADWIAGGKLP